MPNKEWRDANREVYRQQGREYNARLRRRALDALGATCADCGIADHRCLQIHHTHGGGDADRRASGGNQATYRRIVKGDHKGFEVLCANCHMIRHSPAEFSKL
jgi:integrase